MSRVMSPEQSRKVVRKGVAGTEVCPPGAILLRVAARYTAPEQCPGVTQAQWRTSDRPTRDTTYLPQSLYLPTGQLRYLYLASCISGN